MAVRKLQSMVLLRERNKLGQKSYGNYKFNQFLIETDLTEATGLSD